MRKIAYRTEQYLSDFSSEEGNLKRFSCICKIIESQVSLYRSTRDTTVMLIKKEISLKNEKVISRHLNILQRLSVIGFVENGYVLTGEGRALCAFLKHRPSPKQKLIEEERVFYFKILFTSKATTDPLLQIMKSIRKEEGNPRYRAIIAFFESDLAKAIWNAQTVETHLMSYKKRGLVSTFLRNKFRCLQLWLEQLDLVERTDNTTRLTATGKKVIEKTQKYRNTLPEKVYEIASFLVPVSKIKFRFSEHKNILVKQLREANMLFRTRSGTLDIQAVNTFISTKFLLEGIILEEDDFYRSLRNLAKEGIVASLMLGADGRPALMTIKAT